MFFEFPDERKFITDDQILNTHFLVADTGLLVTPIVTNVSNFTLSHLPEGHRWYDFISGEAYPTYDKNTPAPAPPIFVYNPLNTTPPVYLRGGKLVFTQILPPILKSSLQLNNEFHVVAAFDDPRTDIGGQYQSSGNILTLKDYQGSNVAKKCLGDHQCVYQVLLTLHTQQRQVCIRFTPPGMGIPSYETIRIVSIELYGVPGNLMDLDVRSDVEVFEQTREAAKSIADCNLEIVDAVFNIAKLRIQNLNIDVDGPSEFCMNFL